MSYWCDDRSLYLEQRRQDALQAEALERLRKQRPKGLVKELNEESERDERD